MYVRFQFMHLIINTVLYIQVLKRMYLTIYAQYIERVIVIVIVIVISTQSYTLILSQRKKISRAPLILTKI
jgi:hypothetical protein